MYFRVAFGPEWPQGYEAQVNSTFGDPQKSGSLYGLQPILTRLIPPDVWFTQHIIVRDVADGVHIRILLNDIEVVNYVDRERKFSRGHVAFQQHHQGSEVRYRDVEVRELGASGEELVKRYAVFRLSADIGRLSPDERAMLPLFLDAARAMDEVFWEMAYGSREELLARIEDPSLRRYAEINYGPWDRLDGDRAFVPGFGPKPKGARFYPLDATKEELEAAAAKPEGQDLLALCTVVERGEGGALRAVPYAQRFRAQFELAASKMVQAAALAQDAGLKRYLELRAAALRSGDYFPSDMAWMEMKSNGVDLVIGPIETYEDQLFGAKAACEAYVLVKDKVWSERLQNIASLLPEMQRGLPVDEKYKSESPGTDSDLGAYDVVYYAGDCNAGSKTIAINLPNDERVQLQKGTRRLQLQNAMRAKYDAILRPIVDVLLAEDQRALVSFEAFFGNTMFHEVAHGLGIKATLNGKGSVREALRETSSPLEECKADVLGLYLVTELLRRGAYEGTTVEQHYATFLAGIFRSVRFGASSAHGQANMIAFHVFQQLGAFARDEASGTYRVDFEKMRAAVAELARRILVLQGEGDIDGVRALLAKDAVIDPVLAGDLARVAAAGIPVDVVFEQGAEVLGLSR
ncbi:MAG: DUF1080 domain-containing protein [Planctomycetes bacterium]|nr:DUF1080 domain-containing protein [Planctomycetota bacterium]